MLTSSPKNILFVGPYRQADGWGFASFDYLLSLLTTHHNVASAPIYLNPSASTNINNPQILEAEKRHFDHYDIVIQQALPHCMFYNSNAKNIGMLFLENNKIVSDSVQNLNNMDELWVTSNKEKQCLYRSGVSTEIKVVSHPLPTEKILSSQNSNTYMDFGKIINEEYKFYFIGEYIQRKNIKDLIIAFHLEFDITEPVRLIIKTSVPGLSPQQAQNKIKQDIDAIKLKLRIRKKFKDEIIITDKLSQKHIHALHNTCDCFVATSYGEACCRPATEALCFGKKIILSANIGAVELADSSDCYTVSCQEQPVIVEDPTYVAGLDIYNGYETWCIPSILDLRKQLRKAYEDKSSFDKQKYIDKFSYKNIGKILCQYIH